MLKFFYSTQTCSTAIHIALEEAGLPFEGVEVSWKRKVNVAELEAVNPLGQVPVLQEGDKVLGQSIAILERIGDLAPAKNLLPPPGTWERAHAMGWLAFTGSDFQKAFGPIFLASRWTTDTAAQTAIKTGAIETLRKHLDHIDRSLTGKDFILGKQFSVADAFLFTILGWCKWSEVKTSGHKNITAYLKRIYDRPAVQKVLAKEEMMDFFPG